MSGESWYTTPNDPGSANVTISSAVVIAENVNRKWLVICNDSDTVIYIAVGKAAALNKGIRLNANGGNYEMMEGNLNPSAIYGIHGGSGNKVICYQEGE